ncbi:MAG: CHASE domain-containing protein [Pirellulales bacterium]|nr:CHASE domain-containing protein [Pirellulales bacterium]
MDAPRAADVSAPRRRLGNRAQLAMVACLGVAVSLAVFVAFRRAERESLRERFLAHVLPRVEAVEQAFDDGAWTLHVLQAFFDGSVSVDRDEFATFVRPLLRDNRVVVALAWAPRISHDRRAAFEAEARKAGIAQYHVVERLGDGRIVPAAHRRRYVPISYLQPRAGNQACMGFDLAYHPASSAVVEHLHKRHQVELTPPVASSAFAGAPTVVLALTPVLERENVEPADALGSSAVRGYLVAAFDVDALLREALRLLEPVGIDVQVNDVTSPDRPHRVGAFLSPLPVPEGEPRQPDGTLGHTAVVAVGGRRLHVKCTATQAFIKHNTKPYSSTVLGVGLFVTALSTLYVRHHLARTTIVEAIVRRRTAELTAEVAERKRAEAELAQHRDHLEDLVMARTGELARANNELQQEIAEHKESEEQLRHLRNLLSNIINSMPSVLVGVDAQSHVTQWNREAERFTGVAAADALTRPLVDVFPHMANHVEQIQRTLGGNRQPQSPGHVVWSDKDQIHQGDLTVYPLVDNGVAGAVIRLDDVTERVRIEELMVQSEKMLSVGGLAAGMAHEINNPLAGILQNVQVVIDRTSADLPANREAAAACGTTLETVRAYMERRALTPLLEAIRTSGQRAAQIVANMLNFARKSDRAFSSHDLGELLDQTIELAASDYDLKKKYDFRGIEIVRQYDPALPSVPCERTEIQQVVLNLLRNGAYAMADGTRDGQPPCFVVRTSRDGDMARIEIEDNGPGMSDDVRRRAFEPFFTTKGVGEGTGLGLSVSYFIVTENHHGSMHVESAPGGGATFVIRLPLRASRGLAAVEAAP